MVVSQCHHLIVNHVMRMVILLDINHDHIMIMIDDVHHQKYIDHEIHVVQNQKHG
jgi:hypothetical protein